MLLQAADKPPVGPGWVHELKMDGFRALVHVAGEGRARVRLRGGSWVVLPEITEACGSLPAGTVLDGELVCLDGMACDFQAVVTRVMSDGKRGRPVTLVAFDLLWMDGLVMTGVPLEQRKTALAKMLDGSDHPALALSQTFDDGQALLRAAEKLGHEGIVSKWGRSIYRPGKRSPSWLKTRTEHGKAVQAQRSENWEIRNRI